MVPEAVGVVLKERLWRGKMNFRINWIYRSNIGKERTTLRGGIGVRVQRKVKL